MNRLFRAGLCFWWLTGAAADTEKTTSRGNTPEPTSNTTATIAPVTTLSIYNDLSRLAAVSGSATCPGRTVNFITHTLPQQCLRTDRALYNSTPSFGPDHGGTVSPEPADSNAADSNVNSVIHTPSIGATAPVESASPAAETSGLAGSATAHPSPTSREDQLKPIANSEEDSESPLDTANFLSFEEWKTQNLAKLGQSPEDVGRIQPVIPNRPRPGINNALESLGEESELDLDFAGFGGTKPSSMNQNHDKAGPSEAGETTGALAGGSTVRSKDAGKTCKERTNYASFDCSATILKANKECKSASSVLVESKDSYMLNICSAKNKFVIVQLCNDIQVDTVVLANYEFFSGTFRHFRVSVSDRYPVDMDKWRDLGTFEGRNTREIQAFLVENPLIWAKYLRIEFLSHYGTEYYCPVTLLRVHGITMIEDYQHAQDLARGEHMQVTLEAEAIATPPLTKQPLESTDEASNDSLHAIRGDTQSVVGISPHPSPSISVKTKADSAQQSRSGQEDAHHDSNAASASSLAQTRIDEAPGMNTSRDNSFAETSVNAREPTNSSGGSFESSLTTTVSTPTGFHSNGKSAPDAESYENIADASSSFTSAAFSSTSARSDQVMSQVSPSQSITIDSVSQAATSIAFSSGASAHASSDQSSVSTNATRTLPTSTLSAQTAQPSTQESFFKSFHKRLQQLESNSTLSLKYIEEQSRILRDAFSKVEKRQVSSTTRFLSQLNETVMAELHGFKQAYDQLWQGTVIELEGQQETYQREMLALSSRLTMVADELVWQKRMGIIQSTLLVLCLAVALFGRSADGYLEVPLMQQIAALKGGWDSPLDSPHSASPVSLFRRRIWRSKTDPGGDTANLTDAGYSTPQHAEVPAGAHVSPSSPPSPCTLSDHEEPDHEGDRSRNVVRRDHARAASVISSKRNRKKHKKPPISPQGNGRMKSPLAM